MQELSVLAMFGICGLEDLNKKKIHIEWIVCFAAAGILCQIFVWKQPFLGIFTALLPGAALFAVSFITRGGIGEGDGLILMAAGIYIGAACILRVLLYASYLTAGYALYLFVIKRKSRKYEIPFIPFLFLALAVEFLLKRI